MPPNGRCSIKMSIYISAPSPCSSALNPCDANAVCDDTTGSAVCTCNSGYTGNGFQCNDIDECASTSACGANANCINTPGSHRCICKSGFIGDPYKGCTRKYQINNTTLYYIYVYLVYNSIDLYQVATTPMIIVRDNFSFLWHSSLGKFWRKMKPIVLVRDTLLNT